MSSRVLDGIRVLDFSHALAGPYCTMLLANYGADVYKVESLSGGDMGRIWGPPYQGGEAYYFLGLNAGKRAMALDLKRPQARELCLRMMERVDVLIENLRVGSMERFGLGYAAAHARNPRLIYCSISGYGQTGPAREQPAMDLILQASSGVISTTGTEAGEMVRCGHSVGDITAGMFALIGILMALRGRDRTGVGQFVDVSMFDCMISAMASNWANYLGTGINPAPRGTAFASIVPYRTFATADRDIAIAAANEKLWVAFCDAIDRPDLAHHPDYRSNALRVRHRAVLEPLLANILRTAPAAEWQRRLSAVGVPCAPVRTFAEVMADPQTAAREMLCQLQHPTAGLHTVTGLPVKFSATPGRIERAAPLPGQHTREILAELLEVNDAEFEELAQAGVVGAYSAGGPAPGTDHRLAPHPTNPGLPRSECAD